MCVFAYLYVNKYMCMAMEDLRFYWVQYWSLILNRFVCILILMSVWDGAHLNASWSTCTYRVPWIFIIINQLLSRSLQRQGGRVPTPARVCRTGKGTAAFLPVQRSSQNEARTDTGRRNGRAQTILQRPRPHRSSQVLGCSVFRCNLVVCYLLFVIFYLLLFRA